jgi:hypothetical protein
LAGNFWSGKPAARKKNILSRLAVNCHHILCFLSLDSFKTDIAIGGNKRMNGQTKKELEVSVIFCPLRNERGRKQALP